MTDKLLTPQQELFLSLYTDIKSDTFSNATQSAIKAGYEESFAKNITGIMPKWLFEFIGDNKLLGKAERNLEKALDIDITDEKIGGRALEATKFVAERLGKQKYSTRIENTGPDGKNLLTITISTEELELAKQLLEQRRNNITSDTITSESIGTLPELMGGEVPNQE